MLALTLGLHCFDSLGSFMIPPESTWVGSWRVPRVLPALYTAKGGKTYLYTSIDPEDVFPDSSDDSTTTVIAIDVTDPNAPYLAGSVPVYDTNGWYDTYLGDAFSIDSFLYFFGDEGGYFKLFVFSLEPDPTHPKLSRIVPSKVKLPAEGPPKSFGHDNPWEYVPEEGLLYYMEFYYNYLFVFDVSNPAEPKYLDAVRVPIYQSIMRYPYLYSAVYITYDSVTDSVFFYVHKVNRTHVSLISQLKAPGWLFYYNMGYLVSRDGKRKFALIGGAYHPQAVDVTDPYNPKWVEVEDTTWLIRHGTFFTSTPDDKRVYITSFPRIGVVEADSVPKVVCVDTVEPIPEANSVELVNPTWFRGEIYLNADHSYNSWDSIASYIHFLILHYPQDPLPSFSMPQKPILKVPTFHRGLLKIISSKEGWFELKLFSPTGALLEDKRVRLREGVNLIRLEGVKSSGVYFLRVGEENIFKVVVLKKRG